MGWLKKKFKKVTKPFRKAAKKIAKGIKKVGSKIWRGIKNKIIKPVLGVINKLGPIGMIAMSFVLPGIGAMLGPLWSSALTGLQAGSLGTFGQVMAKGMVWAQNAATAAKGFISRGYKGITDKVTESLTQIGGTIKDGATAMWNGAKEAMGIQTPVAPDKVGQLVGQSAQKGFAEAAAQANPELLRAAKGNVLKAGEIAKQQGAFLDIESGQAAFRATGKTGGFTLEANPELIRPTSNINFAKNVAAQQDLQLAAQTQTALEANPEFLRMAGGNVNEASKLAQSQEAFLGRSTVEFAGGQQAIDSQARLLEQNQAELEAKKPDNLAKAAKAFASALKKDDQQQPGFVPFAGGADFADFASNRFGIGGTGSAGGQFLDQSILAQIQAQSRRLEELG